MVFTHSRNPIKGSPFIQCFCQNMNDYGDCLTFEKILKLIPSDLQRQKPPQSPEYKWFANFNYVSELGLNL